MTLIVSLAVAIAVGSLVSYLTARVVIARRLPRYPRTLHRLWARLGGYFYLPCLACYERFGGHEWRQSSVTGRFYLVEDRGVCPVCTDRFDVLAVLDVGGSLTRDAIVSAGLSRGRVRRALARNLRAGHVTRSRPAPTLREHYRISDVGRRALNGARLDPPGHVVVSRGRGR